MDFQIQIMFQLFLAVLLGGFVGLEREYKGKEAGLRTYSLVALGTTLFMLTAFQSYQEFFGAVGLSFDPSRIIQAVAVGIGFLGAGVIIHRRVHVEGLTTAAGLWIAAAVGAAVAVKFYLAAAFTVFLSIIVLSGFRKIEEKYLGKK